jgi:cobalt-zinc-cadmium resistance protein CzcA
LPGLAVTAEYGQINSSYNDTRFGIAQSFEFPTVYSKQKQVLNSEWKTAAAITALKEMDLRKEITHTFYALVTLNEKERLLQKSDSLLTEFLRKASLRLKKGESNILEQTTASLQLGQLKQQVLQLQQEKKMLQSKFQLLLNSETVYEPLASSSQITYTAPLDSESSLHPKLQVIGAQQKSAAAQTQLERAKILPMLTLGYFNNSFQGTGPDAVLYDQNTRFHSMQLGFGIPLLGGSQRAKVKAAKVQEEIMAEEYSWIQQSLTKQLELAQQTVSKNQEKIRYFETTALPNATLIITTANNQFSSGNINYLDWVMLISQAISVENQYIESVSAYNESVIELYYLTSKI